MSAPISGDSVTDVGTLLAGAQIVKPVVNSRGKNSFARKLAVKNTGAGDLLISYGNGKLCDPIPVAAGTPFETEGPITTYTAKSVAGTTYAFDLKVA
jgi:hypothetical protein